MCGIAAIVSNQNVNQDLYDALTVLQHRGQDAAGIVTCEGSRLHLRKDNGLTRDVFSSKEMLKLKGSMGIAHVRYPTAGCTSSEEAQPFYVNSPFGLTLAHNGNLTNTEELKIQVFVDDQRHINTGSDSEVLLNVFAHELQQAGKLTLTIDDVFKAVTMVHKRCRGAYAVVVMIAGFGILGFRDPHGIRPIVFGERKTEEDTTDYMIASESVALDVLDFRLIRDIAPGEAVFIEASGKLHTKQCAEKTNHCPCIFEYVYFARPDSIIDNISVYKARMRMGKKLAKKIEKDWPNHDIDVVIPIPDTSRTAALQIAHELGVKFREGFMKNRYIGRTFIMPGQKMRKKSVKQKLNAIALEFSGKNVLLVDDSVVRGTTSEQIIQMARDAGAKKVYFASAAPPVRYPNVYGIDMPAAHELIAHGRTEQEVCKAIGADKLIYQELEDLIDAVGKGNPNIKQFDTSCFSHEYITGDIDDEYLARIEALRNDGAQEQRNSANTGATK
ncbi:amidophosphoribosyltransferase [Methylomonas sp. LL1]|uniref:amidophosphoribosyltransferase n=1 Tax=Methylomonas sp. LL1 TaxID=2785785 RepID=UPI0018C3B31C|nr:amidophosphoribosyltransferase [Methylomonas sp. LL1]QPK63863.1 amidophosphoribosyltransferase [Methylomonas sp. LL1]